MNQLRDSWRTLARGPGFSVTVVVTLAIGIGLNTAIFTVLDALVLKPLPYPRPDALVLVAEWPATGGNYTVAPSAYLDWRERLQSFSHFEVRESVSLAVDHDGIVEEVRGYRVSPGYFEMLGAQPVVGRPFTTEDARPGAPCRIIVSHRFYASRLELTARIGDPVRVNGDWCDLTGVLPPETVLDRQAADLYLAKSFTAADAAREGRSLTVIARMRPGVSLDTARDEVAAVAASFNANRGAAGRGWSARLTPLRDVVIPAESRRLATILFAAVGSVLLVACLNVASLALSRTTARRRELAIRAALGATRGQIARLLLAESVCLAVAGGALGLLVGSWALRALTSLAPAGTLPPEAVASLDARALIFTAALSIATGVLAGIAPSLRGRTVPAMEALAGTRTTVLSPLTARLHNGLLVVQTALAIALVVVATALATSFIRLTNVDPGFSPDDVLTARLSMPANRYESGEAVAAGIAQVVGEIRRLPGVEHAAAVTSLPLGGWLYGSTFSVVGESEVERRPSAHIQHVTDGYPETLGMALDEGRWFSERDRSAAPRVAVVNETFVRRYLNGTSATGRQLHIGSGGSGADADARWEIVGVLKDVKTGGLGDAPQSIPEIYVPHQQVPTRTVFVAVRMRSGDRGEGVALLRAAVRRIDPDLPLGAVLSMNERLGRSVDRERFRTVMMGASGALALLLSCLGIYAVRSQALTVRMRELGVRLAVGAAPEQLRRMVLGQAIRQAALGTVLGVGLAVSIGPFVQPWLFATRASDPLVLIASCALFAAAALAASWIPARRASRVDPLLLLRQD